MKFTGEFFIPPEHSDEQFSSKELQLEHKHRYLSILNAVKNKIVLDIACGEGYGADMISGSASHVYAVDINPELVKNAAKQYPRQNISFLAGSVTKIPLPDHAVDVVVSFETIEHISADDQKKFLAEAKRVLKPGGLMIVSTPDKKNYTERYSQHNPFHVHELYREELVDLLKNCFEHVNLYGQGLEITSLIFNKDAYEKNTPLASFKVNEDAFNFDAKYLIALCSDNYEQAHTSIAGIVPESENTHFQLIDRLVQMNKEVEELGAWGKRANDELVVKKEELDVMEQQLKEKKEALRLKEDALKSKNDELKLVEDKMKDIQQKVQDTEQILNDRITEIQQLNKELTRKDFDIHKLRSEKEELEAKLLDIYVSDGWRLLSIYYRFKGKYMKRGSKVYNRLKAIKNKLSFRKGQPVNSPFITALMSEPKSKLIPDVPVNIQFPIKFSVFNYPTVSIIIPAYNNWEFTRNCLISIYQHTHNVTYEVIVGDNVSEDETINLETYFTNVNYIRNKENLGYIRNINNAASYARGEFILTLNNDTTVTPNWLSSLVDVMRRDPSVGLVGSKLVFPDGTLQEAGGIIWKDASGWNYGRGKDPDAPEFNYLKEVDYISGASNLVRKELWDRLKGLDERYVPAYFDDSDLAFNIRALGYKVVYQPLSVVIHYEGLTHGTSTTSGTKKYQAINAEKFIDKWKETLEKDQFANAENVFVARERSRYKKTILVIDHYVPQFDKDAGSRTTFQLLQLFVKLNYNVKFVGDDFFRYEPYTTRLQQMGIEVLYGEWYRDNWQNWMRENSQYIDFFYINRPHISIKYINDLKKISGVKIIYYGHDLHFVREQRQYEIEKRPELLKSAEQWKKTEMELVEKSDVVLTLSTDEKEIIEKEGGKKNVYVMPAFYYTSFPQPITDFDKRNHLFFVGGFAHKPNIDAAIWFAKEVFPVIEAKLKGVKLIIAGSKPPAEVTGLASENINVLGYVADEALEQLYNNVKIVVIPLRYGAGVKGKTVETIHHGVPFVATSFGIEGLQGIEALTTSYNTPEAFANRVIELYNDNDQLAEFSRKAIAYATENFSEKKAESIILKAFS